MSVLQFSTFSLVPSSAFSPHSAIYVTSLEKPPLSSSIIHGLFLLSCCSSFREWLVGRSWGGGWAMAGFAHFEAGEIFMYMWLLLCARETSRVPLLAPFDYSTRVHWRLWHQTERRRRSYTLECAARRVTVHVLRFLFCARWCIRALSFTPAP